MVGSIAAAAVAAKAAATGKGAPYGDPYVKTAVAAGMAGTCVGGFLGRFASQVCGERTPTFFLKYSGRRRTLFASVPWGDSLDQRGLEDVQELQGGALLVNELVKKQWSYINVWYEKTVRELVQPLLGKAARITTCHLGIKPAFIGDPILTATYLQDWECPARDRRNFRIEGHLDCTGDGRIGVEIMLPSFLGNTLDIALAIRGTIVIELVKLADDPPWFEGVRIHFPDMPEVFLQNFEPPTWLGGLTKAWQKKSLEALILDAIKDGIKQNAVLPKRFVLPLSDGIDPIYLSAPRPKGILRIGVAKEERRGRLGSTWTPILEKSSCSEKVAKFEISIGADTRVCEIDLFNPVPASGQAEEINESVNVGTLLTQDFLINGWGHQRITIRSHCGEDQNATEDIVVSDVIRRQGVDGSSSYRLANLKMHGHSLILEAEWRPFAQYRQEIRPLAPSPCEMREASDRSEPLHLWQTSRWHIGEEWKSTWAVFIDVYHAAGLYGRRSYLDPSQEEHWTEISAGSAKFQPACSSVPARTLHERGVDTLALALKKDKKSFQHHLEQVSHEEWRQFLYPNAPQTIWKNDGFDVEWNQSFSCCLDAHTSPDVVEIEVKIFRRTKYGKQLVGQTAVPLSALTSAFESEEKEVLSKTDYFELKGPSDEDMGHIKLGVHVRLLKPALNMKESNWISDRVDQMTKLVRQTSRRASSWGSRNGSDDQEANTAEESSRKSSKDEGKFSQVQESSSRWQWSWWPFRRTTDAPSEALAKTILDPGQPTPIAESNEPQPSELEQPISETARPPPLMPHTSSPSELLPLPQPMQNRVANGIFAGNTFHSVIDVTPFNSPQVDSEI